MTYDKQEKKYNKVTIKLNRREHEGQKATGQKDIYSGLVEFTSKD